MFSSPEVSVAWLLGGETLPASVDPDQDAVVWDGGRLTYRELKQSALSLARSFADLGLEAGDVVLSHLHNRGEILQIYFACAYAGMTFVPGSFRLTAPELAGVLAESGARLLFTEAPLQDVALGAVADPRNLETKVVTLEASSPGVEFAAMSSGPEAVGPYPRTDPHIVLFSSGTTGRPKGIMLSHRNIVFFGFQQTSVWPRYRRGMRLLLVAAMFNTGGINEIVIPTFAVGGTVFIMPSRNWSAERMIGYINSWGITHTTVFPTMFGPILDLDERTGVDLGPLEAIMTGGEMCPPAMMARWLDRWPTIDLCIGYGLTEGGIISFISNEDIRLNPTSVGRLAPGQAVRIVDADGQPVPVGQVGEILTASDSVTPGYWKEPDLTAVAIVDGWLRTGDLGRLSDDGHLHIEGRSRDMIISKGQNIFPAEIEAVLAGHPEIQASAVVGVPDSEFGEAVCAVVVPAPGHDLTEGAVTEFVTAAIASYKKPRHVVFVDSLPVGPSNKVLKGELAAMMAAEIAGRAAGHAKAGEPAGGGR